MIQPKLTIKQRSIGLCLGIFLSCFAPLAHAQGSDEDNGTFFGKQAKGKWLIGVKAAKIDTNDDSNQKADAIGVILGYEFFREIGAGGSSTVEFEYLSSDKASFPLGGEYEADIANLFFTFRSAGSIYYKLKGGLSYTKIDSRLGALEQSFDDVALVGGIGLGYKFEHYGRVEVEYSKDSGENDIGIFGLNALLEF